jgi:hypothetical protein
MTRPGTDRSPVRSKPRGRSPPQRPCPGLNAWVCCISLESDGRSYREGQRASEPLIRKSWPDTGDTRMPAPWVGPICGRRRVRQPGRAACIRHARRRSEGRRRNDPTRAARVARVIAPIAERTPNAPRRQIGVHRQAEAQGRAHRRRLQAARHRVARGGAACLGHREPTRRGWQESGFRSQERHEVIVQAPKQGRGRLTSSDACEKL